MILFRITGKCHLSINKQYNWFYSSSHAEESKGQIQHAEQSIKRSVSVSVLRNGGPLHFITHGVTVLLWKKYYPRHSGIQCESLFPSSIPAHILQGQRYAYFAHRSCYSRFKVYSQTDVMCDSLLSPLIIYYQLRIWPMVFVWQGGWL